MRRSIVGAILSLLLASGCCPMTAAGNHDGPSTPARSRPLAARLAALDLTVLAASLAADPQADALWRDYPDRADYVALVEDAGQPAPIRFAAALALRSRADHADPAATARALAAGLRDDLAGYAQPWGRLWAGDDVGVLGAAVVELGSAAVPALTDLLDDTTPRDVYIGSEEATELAMRGYRVKDFAAFYLARIVGVELAWEPDLARRDTAIEALRARVPAAPAPGGGPDR